MANLLDTALNRTQTPNSVIPKTGLTIDFNTKNKIKPFEAKGRMLPSRIFGSPIEYVKGMGKDIVNIKNGAKGKANDHELGRMNDIAMKAGGLALAAYLFAKNPLKLSKTMEFVGFGTFFASMALWPKLLIQAPLKARTGVDIHQKYQDSYGRKKLFFQDPQYVPWDMVDIKDLNKMGDKLKIPKDAPNREEVIKQKAQKIAVQGNTLWMLTAGFATPLLSALSCNLIEKGIGKAQLAQGLRKTEEAMGALKQTGIEQSGSILDKATYQVQNKQVINELEKFFTANANQSVDQHSIDQIVSVIAPKDIPLQQAARREMQQVAASMQTNTGYLFTKDLGTNIGTIVKKYGIDPKKLSELIQSKGEGFTVTKENIDTLMQEICSLSEKALPKNQQAGLEKIMRGVLSKGLTEAKAPTIGTLQESATRMAKIFDEFGSQKSVVDQYVNARLGENSGSFIAKQWNQVCQTLFDVLGIKDKDIAKAKSTGTEVADLIEKKLSTLVQDDDQYKAAMKKLTDAIAEYDTTVAKDGFIQTAHQGIDTVANRAARNFRAEGFEHIARTLVGENSIEGTVVSSGKYLVDDVVRGAQSSFYRMVQAMDVFRRIETQGIQKQLVQDSELSKLFEQLGDSGLAQWLQKNSNEFLSGRKSLDSLVDLFKDELLVKKQGRYSEELLTSLLDSVKSIGKKVADAAPVNDEATQTLIKKLKNIMLNYKITDYTEKLYDVGPNGYRKIMGLLFKGDLDQATVDSMPEAVQKGLARYKQDFIDNIGNFRYWYKNQHVIDGATSATDCTLKHRLTGKTICDTITDHANTVFNSNKWLKIFGGATAALVGITLISQQFFGKMKKEDVYAKGQQNDKHIK